MYILKIQGTTQIPDYIQIRDDDFTLIEYFRSKNIDKIIERLGLKHKQKEIIETINNVPYAKLKKINI